MLLFVKKKIRVSQKTIDIFLSYDNLYINPALFSGVFDPTESIFLKPLIPVASWEVFGKVLDKNIHSELLFP